MVEAFVFGIIIGFEVGLAVMRIAHIIGKDRECSQCLEFAEKMAKFERQKHINDIEN